MEPGDKVQIIKRPELQYAGYKGTILYRSKFASYKVKLDKIEEPITVRSTYLVNLNEQAKGEDMSEMKNYPGIETEVPSEVELTDLAFETIRKAEQNGFAFVDVSAQHTKAVNQLAQIAYCVGYYLYKEGGDSMHRVFFKEGEPSCEVWEEKTFSSKEGIYMLITRKAHKKGHVNW